MPAISINLNLNLNIGITDDRQPHKLSLLGGIIEALRDRGIYVQGGDQEGALQLIVMVLTSNVWLDIIGCNAMVYVTLSAYSEKHAHARFDLGVPEEYDRLLNHIEGLYCKYTGAVRVEGIEPSSPEDNSS